MRVAIVTFNKTGGLNHYIACLANELSKICELRLFVPIGFDRSWIENVDVREMPIPTSAGELGGFALHPERFLHMFEEIRDFKPDIIHVNERDMGFFPVLALFNRKKIVLTIHDPVPHPGSKSWYSMIETPAFLYKAPNIIVHGEKFRSYYPEKRVFVIPHGEYGRFKTTSGGVPEEEDTVLFFGRINKYKGIDILLKAMKDVWSIRPQTKLIIAGEGDLKALGIEIDGQSGIEIINKYIPNEEVSKLFQRAAIVVLPYIEGSQSGVLATALALGKPTIATKVGCFEETIESGKNGILVNPGESEGLKDAILELLENKSLRQVMGKNAKDYSDAFLQWAPIAKSTLEAYNKILEKAQ
jgi:glycosyltransferase involved in cell wall biosynthesis